MTGPRHIVRLGLALWAFVAAARLQGQDTSGTLLEIEGMAGYTPVEMEKWANRASLDKRDQRAYGINARILFIQLGRSGSRVGFEFDTRQLFRYELFGQAGASLIREKQTVASQRLAVVARFRDSRRVRVDAGLGIDFFSDYSLPSFHAQATYLLFDGRKFRLPVGARIEAILNETATALPMCIVSGVAIRL